MKRQANSVDKNRLALGEVLRGNRKASGASQEAVAEAMGVSQGTVSNMERGLYVTPLDAIYDVANAYDVTPARLVEQLGKKINKK